MVARSALDRCWSVETPATAMPGTRLAVMVGPPNLSGARKAIEVEAPRFPVRKARPIESRADAAPIKLRCASTLPPSQGLHPSQPPLKYISVAAKLPPRPSRGTGAAVDRPKFTGSLAAPSSSRTATCAPYLRPPIAGPNGGNATEGAIRNASRAASSPSVWAQTGSAPRAETKIQMSQYRRVTWAVLKAYPSSGSHHALNSRRRASSCPWATSFEGLAHNCTRLPAVVRMVV
jgi:hypothetical protein